MAPLAIAVVDIVLLVLVVLVGALAAGGGIAIGRRTRAGEDRFAEQLQAAERALVQAQATDRGWDRALMEAAARDAVAARLGATAISAMQLVEVIDRPGTDADQAVFRVQTADGEVHRITLGRTAGVWGAA